jgi:trimeric autotransporter adhesin
MSIRSYILTLLLLFTFGLIPLLPSQATPARGQSTAQGTAELLERAAVGAPEFSSTPQQLTPLGAQIVYTAETIEQGRELWASDGTPEGTRLVKDLTPGATGTLFGELTVVGETVFFFTGDSDPLDTTFDLWRSDGSAAGTRLVASRVTRTQGVNSVYRFSAAFGGRLFFFAGEQLWASDGSSQGTGPLATIPTLGNSPPQFSVIGGRLFFSAGSSANELWVSDGTPAGTRLLKRFGNSIAPTGLSQANSLLVFLAGREIWSSDGTPGGTRLLRQFPLNAVQASFGSSGSLAFFIATGSDGNSYLWRSDGSARGTLQLKQVPRTLNNTLAPPNFTAAGGLIYYLAAPQQLWRSDGSVQGTIPLAEECCQEIAGAFGDQIVFSAEAAEGGFAFWTSDGTPTRTIQRVLLPNKPVATVSAGQLLFVTLDDGVRGQELWSSRAFQTPTILYDAGGAPSRSFPQQLMAAGASLLYHSFAPTTGSELWATDGTPESARLLKDINPGLASSQIKRIGTLGARALFSADDGVHGVEIWSSDGTPGGTTLLKDIRPGPETPFVEGLGDTPIVGGLLYFIAFDGSELGLWVSDATPAGTRMVAPVNVNTLPKFISLKASNGRVFFGIGASIWVSNGTPEGTGPLKTPGGWVVDAAAHGPDGDSLIKVVLSWGEIDQRYEIWRSDGTEAGTVTLARLPSSVNSPGMVYAGGKLFFFNYNEASGIEPWVSDGTPDGTRLLKDLRAGPANSIGAINPALCSSYPMQSVALDERFVFVADDGVHGSEPWVSDGTPDGTQLLKDIDDRDIAGAPASSNPYNLAVLNGKLLFIAANASQGYELWASDGTPEGTRTAADLNSGPTHGLAYTIGTPSTLCPQIFGYQPLVQLGDDLTFVGDSPSVTQGIWRIRAGVDAYAAPAFSSATPGQIASVPVRLGNRRLDAATLTVSVRLDSGLAYLGDTSGISPTISGQTLSWTLPQFGVGAHDFLLVLQAPDAPLGTRLAYELRVAAEGDADPSNDVATGELLISRRQLLPAILRAN